MEKLVKQRPHFFKRDVFERFAEIKGIAFVVDHMRKFPCKLGGVKYLDIGSVGCALDAVEILLVKTFFEGLSFSIRNSARKSNRILKKVNSRGGTGGRQFPFGPVAPRKILP